MSRAHCYTRALGDAIRDDRWKPRAWHACPGYSTGTSRSRGTVDTVKTGHPRGYTMTGREEATGGVPRLRELAAAMGLLLAYEIGRLIQVTDPLANAGRLWRFERWAGLAVERGLQAWLVDHPWLVEAMAWYYLPMHVVPFVGLFLYHLYKGGPGYWRFRRAAYGVILPAIVVFSLFPVAPPRLLDATGLVDLVTGAGAPGLGAPLVAQLANEFGAFPSEHVTWAVVVAYTLARVHDVRWLPVGVLHVVVTSVAVVATGHHFLVDALAGLALGGAGIWLAERVSFPGEPARGHAP